MSHTLRFPMIKICGITSRRDLFHTIDAGATAVGFNLWRHSPRSVSASDISRLVDGAKGVVDVIILSVSPSIDELNEIQERWAPAAIQVHRVSPKRFNQLRAATTAHLLPCAAVKDDSDCVEAFNFMGDALVVDAFDPRLPGGTGHTPPRELAKEICERRRTILAGGLTARTVAEAIAYCLPAGVDVASGVEAGPGLKNPILVTEFIAQARMGFRLLSPLSSS